MQETEDGIFYDADFPDIESFWETAKILFQLDKESILEAIKKYKESALVNSSGDGV